MTHQHTEARNHFS